MFDLYCSSRHQRRHENNRDSSLGSSFRRKRSTRSPSTGEGAGSGAGSERRRERRQRRERKYPPPDRSSPLQQQIHRRSSAHRDSSHQVGLPGSSIYTLFPSRLFRFRLLVFPLSTFFFLARFRPRFCIHLAPPTLGARTR